MSGKEEPKWIEERILRFVGFKSKEEAEEFLKKVSEELDNAQRGLEAFTYHVRKVIRGLDKMIGYLATGTIDDEIEFLKRRIKELENLKKKRIEE